MSRLGLLPLVLLAVVVTMHGALFGGLVYDDLSVIAGNPLIDHPTSWWATLTTPLWGENYPHWRPLTQLVLAISYTAGGAGAIHGVSLLLHLGAVSVVWRLARQLGCDPRVGALVALGFGVHAVQAESVAWAAGINDPLWGVCGLLALDCHLRASPARLAPGAVVFTALALAAKETGVVVPVLLVCADLWRMRCRGEQVRWLRLWPLCVVVIVWFGARMLVFGDPHAGFDRGLELDLSAARTIGLPFELLGGNAALLVWPWPLSMFRALPVSADLGSWLRIGVGVVMVVVALCAFWRRAGLVALGVGLATASLFPYAMRPASLGDYPLADRYLYFTVFAGWLALAPWLARVAVFWSALLCCVGHAITAFARTHDFANQATFVAAHADAGDARVSYMAGQLDLEAQPPRIAAARATFQRALAQVELPRTSDAQSVLRLRADIAAGLAWCDLLAALATPRPDVRVAAQGFARLLSTHETHAPAHAGYGVCLAELGDLAGAEQHLRRAIELEPRLATARANLARVQTLRMRR